MESTGKRLIQSRMYRFEQLALKVEKTVGVGMIILLIILTTLQILGRYIFRSPLGWTEEGARFVFVWAIFYGSAVAARQQKHIRVDLLTNMFGKRTLALIGVFIDLCSFLFLIIMIPPAVKYAFFARELIAVAVRVSLFYVYISLPVGFSLMAVFYFINLYKGVRLMITERK